MFFIPVLLFKFIEKEEMNDIRGINKVQSKSIILPPLDTSLAATKSDHLVKLNLDIGSMVEVSYF